MQVRQCATALAAGRTGPGLRARLSMETETRTVAETVPAEPVAGPEAMARPVMTAEAVPKTVAAEAVPGPSVEATMPEAVAAEAMISEPAVEVMVAVAVAPEGVMAAEAAMAPHFHKPGPVGRRGRAGPAPGRLGLRRPCQQQGQQPHQNTRASQHIFHLLLLGPDTAREVCTRAPGAEDGPRAGGAGTEQESN